jgi:two-component system, OmpR family, response regulator
MVALGPPPVVLLEELWNYHTHLVDIHMWQLRRNVDRPHQSPMIYNVRRAGLILRAPA